MVASHHATNPILPPLTPSLKVTHLPNLPQPLHLRHLHPLCLPFHLRTPLLISFSESFSNFLSPSSLLQATPTSSPTSTRSFNHLTYSIMAQSSQPKNLRILQWNCLSFRQRRAAIINLSNDYDVILLCETWLNPPDNASLKGFVVIRNHRPAGRGGGTAICIRNSIPFKIIPTYNSPNIFESTAISILTTQGELLIISAYRPPNTSFNNTHINSFLDSITPYNTILLSGDFNCHNTAGVAAPPATLATPSFPPSPTTISL